MKPRKPERGARKRKNAREVSPIDSLVSYEEMVEIRAKMADLLHRMVDACIALSDTGKPGNN